MRFLDKMLDALKRFNAQVELQMLYMEMRRGMEPTLSNRLNAKISDLFAGFFERKAPATGRIIEGEFKVIPKMPPAAEAPQSQRQWVKDIALNNPADNELKR